MSLIRSSEVIIVGSGITGAALAYELAYLGIKVLLLEQSPHPSSATRHSYGGISYWAGITHLTRSLCAESIQIHRQLSEILDASTEFRELPLIGTIGHEQDPNVIFETFQDFTESPQLLNPQDAYELEPLLNPNAIAAAILMPYAHINPRQTVEAYVQGMERLGGKRIFDSVIKVVSERSGVQIFGENAIYSSDRAIICAGGATRALLQDSGIPLRQYFSHAESIETDRCPDIQMQTVVMPAEIRRFNLETAATIDDSVWSTEENEDLLPPILDCGGLQFADGHFRFGQISRTQTSLTPDICATASERWMRNQLSQILPKIALIPGKWRTCTVAFSADHLPIVGPVDETMKIQVFSGFSNPMALIPATARRFAAQLASSRNDSLLDKLLPSRFVSI